MIGYVLTVTGAAAAAWLLVYVFIGLARRHLLDVPKERSSHARPTPRGGGVGIVIVVLAGSLIGRCFAGYTVPIWLLAAAFLVAAVSLVDDLRTIGSGPRFAAHSAAMAIVVVAGSVPVHVVLPLGIGFSTGFVPALLVAMFWGMGLTNVYNFMDGIDGIAGVQALAAGAGWAAAGLILGVPSLELMGLLILGASAGFLLHNWSPARIFMGDVGSAFLGFTFAALVFVPAAADPRLPLAALLFVWPFVFDGTFTILRRLLRGENIFQPHRAHLYQRMVIAGRSHARISLLYGGLAAASMMLGVAWLLALPFADVAALAGITLIPAVLLFQTKRVERAALQPASTA